MASKRCRIVYQPLFRKFQPLKCTAKPGANQLLGGNTLLPIRPSRHLLKSPGKNKDMSSSDRFPLNTNREIYIYILSIYKQKKLNQMEAKRRSALPRWEGRPRCHSKQAVPSARRFAKQSGHEVKPSHTEGLPTNVDPTLWMDEIHFAPPKKPWNDDSPVNTNKQWFFHGFKTVQNFVHPQYEFQPQFINRGKGPLQCGLIPTTFHPEKSTFPPPPDYKQVG